RSQTGLIDRGAQRDRGMRAEDLRPGCAHRVPEIACVVEVSVGSGEVGILDSLVTRHTVFTRQIRSAGVQSTVGPQGGLEVVFLLHPTPRRDRVAVRAQEHLVILANTPLAAR